MHIISIDKHNVKKNLFEIVEKSRSEKTTERESLNRFKSELGRFSRYYSYITQLIEMGDADLGSCTTFVKLLAKRLNGIRKEQIDLSGLILTGSAIHEVKMPKKGNAKTLDPLEVNDSDATDRKKNSSTRLLSVLVNSLVTLANKVPKSTLCCR